MGLFPVLGSQAQAAPEDEAISPTVEVVGMTPEILVSEETLTLKVHLSGFEDEPGERLRLRALVQADPFDSASEVDDFLRNGRSDGWDAGELDLSPEVVAAARTKQGANVTLSIPTSDLPLWNEEAWGPYGVTLVLSGTRHEKDKKTVPTARTLLLWYPSGSAGHTNINVTVSGSQTMTPSDVNTLRSEGVTFALSPSEVRQMLREPATGPTEVVMLPEGGASLSLLATTGQEDLYTLADNSRDQFNLLTSLPTVTTDAGTQSSEEASLSSESLDKKLSSAGISLLSDLIVADEGWLGLRTVQRAGSQTVLSPPEGLSTLAAGGFTPSSRFHVDTADGQTIVDPTTTSSFGTILDSWGHGWASLNQDLRVELGLNDLSGRQRVRAFTAMATREDPRDTLDLFVHANLSQLGSDPRARITEILDAPWVRPVTLTKMLNSETSHIQRWPLHDFSTAGTRATKAQLEPLNAQVVRTLAIMSAAVNPEDAPTERFIPSLEAAQADLAEAERGERVAAAIAGLKEETEVISIVPSATVNVMGRNVPFPVTVSNSGSVPLHLLIGLEISDPRLHADQWTEAVVPASGSVTVHVPVEALGAGQVAVLAVAKTEGDVRLDASEEITVNVQADWEDTVTWVVGGILIAFFALGLVRTVRKGRRSKVAPDQGNRA